MSALDRYINCAIARGTCTVQQQVLSDGLSRNQGAIRNTVDQTCRAVGSETDVINYPNDGPVNSRRNIAHNRTCLYHLQQDVKERRRQYSNHDRQCW